MAMAWCINMDKVNTLEKLRGLKFSCYIFYFNVIFLQWLAVVRLLERGKEVLGKKPLWWPQTAARLEAQTVKRTLEKIRQRVPLKHLPTRQQHP